MLKAGHGKLNSMSGNRKVGVANWRPSNERSESGALDTIMDVTTPENISFHYQVVGPFRRAFAYFIDIVISLGSYLLLALLVYLIFAFVLVPLAAAAGLTSLIGAVAGLLTGMAAIGYFIVYWFYGAYMETYFNGQTLGKRLTKMRVITTDGHAIDGVQATLRNFFRLLDMMPVVPVSAIFMLEQPVLTFIPTGIFGLVYMTINRRFQRIGDLVANTVVVNEELKQQPNLATFMDERVPQLAELIPTSYVVSGSMARTIADYVDQRKYLPFLRAAEIASYLATPLIEKFGIAADTDHDLFLCALYYKTYVSAHATEDAVPLPAIADPPPTPATVEVPPVSSPTIPDA